MALLEEDSAFSELLDLESLDPSLLLRMTSFAELLDVTELLDFTLLLDTLVSLSLDFGVTLEELLDFAFELLEPSQSSQADEESPLGRVAKSLLSSSPQATSTAATTATIKNFFKVINYPPSRHSQIYIQSIDSVSFITEYEIYASCSLSEGLLTRIPPFTRLAATPPFFYLCARKF